MRTVRLVQLVLLLCICLMATFGLVHILYAQDDTVRVDLLPPIGTEDRGDKLGVFVPFQLRAGQDRALDNAQISGLRLRLVDMPEGALKTFDASKAVQIATPLGAAIVIDASGSMEPYMNDVRAAARNAVSTAPSNVQFRITSFHGRDANGRLDYRLHQDFTENRGGVVSAIDSITEPKGATCYYDAVYEALLALDQWGQNAGQNARKAVIAFTDGDDRISATDARPCSSRSIDEVIQTAQRANIPIFTIGMYGTNPANIKDADLRRLANETQGLAAIGGESEIDALFKQVFAGMINQYFAVFDVQAKPGRNEAVLEVQLAGVSEPVGSPLLAFDSPKNYIPTPTPIPTSTPPPPTPTPLPAPTATLPPSTKVILDAPRLDAERGVYIFAVNLDHPRIVKLLTFDVLEGNVRVPGAAKEAPINGLDTAQVEFEVDMNSLKPDREYTVQVQGLDTSGHRLLVPQDEYQADEPPNPILAELKFKHEADKPIPLVASIFSIEPDVERGVLVLRLDINQPALVDDYRAFINNDAGYNVVDTEQQVYPPGQAVVEVPMPEAAKAPSPNPAPQKYEIWLRLWTAANEPTDTDHMSFELTPPATPGMFEQITAGLEQNPLLALGIVVVISSLVLWFILGRRPKKEAFKLTRPVEEYTIAAGAATGGGKQRGKLLVEVIETPSAADRVKRTITRLPCVIGRSQECDIRLTGDAQLSRQHARLTVENGRIQLTDLGSNNGTFVDNNRIAPNTPTTLSDAQEFRLGRNTKIRVSLQY